MLWHTEMACGVHLGILLICLVQAEHVRCLWATQAQSSQRQNGKAYVGFLQQYSGPGRLGDSYPQNRLRRSSAQSSSFSTDIAGNSAYSKGLSSSGYTQTLSQPAKSSSVSVRLVRTNSKPNWQLSKTSQVNAPKNFFGLSTSIASGSSVSQYKKNDLADMSKKRTWSVQQGTPRASKYVSSSSASVQSPLSTSKSASHQKAPAAAQTPALYGQRGHAPVKSSSLFSAGAAVPQKSPVQMRTSATGHARRVFKTSTPSRFTSLQNERTRNDPGQTEAGKRYKSKLFPGSSKPASTSSMASNYASYGKSLPASNKQNAPLRFQPRSQNMPTSQRSSYKPLAEQLPSRTSTLQTSWNSGNLAQGARNLPSSRSGGTGTAGPRYAPTRIYDIPECFGGFAIRRLKDPDDQELSVQKPQATYTPPRQTYPAPSQKPSTAPSRQTYAPSWQRYPAPSQKPYLAPSQKPSVAPSQQTYAPSWQRYPAPSQKPYLAPSQKPSMAPSQQSESPKPQVPSVHQPSKWMRIRPRKQL